MKKYLETINENTQVEEAYGIGTDGMIKWWQRWNLHVHTKLLKRKEQVVEQCACI